MSTKKENKVKVSHSISLETDNGDFSITSQGTDLILQLCGEEMIVSKKDFSYLMTMVYEADILNG